MLPLALLAPTIDRACGSENHEPGANELDCRTVSDPAPPFEIDTFLVDDTATLPKSTTGDGRDGRDENIGTAEHDSLNDIVGLVGSLVESTRLSTNAGVDADPIGGMHMIEIVDAGDPLFKFEIGSPDEIENHDPDENIPD